MTISNNDLDLLAGLVLKARAAGADAADAILVRSAASSHARRLGAVEHVERQESRDLGLRVLVGKQQAANSSTDLSAEAQAALIERTVAMASAVPADPWCGLADQAEIARVWGDLDLDDPIEPTPEALAEAAAICEAAALGVKGVSNSEGAEAGWGRSQMAVVASNGFVGAWSRTSHSVSVSVIAGEGTAMERDYDWTSAVHRADLVDAATIGRRAGERTVALLGARRLPSRQMPVVFEPRVASGLLRSLVGAISGTSVARRASFLMDDLGKRLFAPGIVVRDDPLRRRGARSQPFDGDGIAGAPRNIVEDGVLTSWLLDLQTARHLGLETTGHGTHGTGGSSGPSPSNLWLAAGSATPEELMADIKDGFYVTSMMGMGVSMVTGDYSRGAGGFRIENGRLTHPVSEVTVAGNLRDMFAALVPANDLIFRWGLDTPTIRIDGMTVAGGG
ncbi:MAG: TldD/PmbA family protein [Alphaproteobacteria bacterium]|nr:TldD/PmbA family protein [Alphaproteobacteria bacterium]